jgi:hypothetical protein
MSSKKTNMNFHNRGVSVEFMASWNVLGAPVKPNGITTNSNWPKMCLECGFEHLAWPQKDLVETRTEVQFGKPSSVNQLIE